MIKTRSKKLSLLLVLMMLATMFVGVGTASASGTITALSTPTLNDDPTTAQAMGTIKVSIPAGAIASGDSVIFKLASGFDFFPVAGADNDFSETAVAASTGLNQVVVPTKTSANVADTNAVAAASVLVEDLDETDEVQLTVSGAVDVAADFVFYIYLPSIEVDTGTSDDCVVTFDAPSNSGFAEGTVVVGKSTSTGSVTLAVSGTDSDDSDFNFELRVKEDAAGSLEVGDEALKIKLPSGFEWSGAATTTATLTPLWGEPIHVTVNKDDEELTVDFDGVDSNADGIRNGTEITAPVDTSVASAWDIADTILAFSVEDEDAADEGDVTATITGETDANVSSAVVGTYGELGAAVTAASTPDVISGQDEQEIGNITVTEALGDSLVAGRTITFTLCEGARWQPEYEDNIRNDAENTQDLDNFDADEGVSLTFNEFTGTDNRTAKFTVANPAPDDPATLVLKNTEIAVEPGFEGDVTVEVGGNAGITGTVVVAKAKSAVSASAASTPDVVIGLSGQTLGEFTVKENIAGAFQDDGTIIFDLPAGCVFPATPTVEVTEGDLTISNIKRANTDNQISMTVESESSTPSTIKVSGAKIKIDRTVAEGDIIMKVQGSAVAETGGANVDNVSGYSDWNNSDTAAKCAIAKVTTPAGEIGSTAVFTFDSTTYKVNGIEKTASVAPYAENNRTYVSIRDVAYALGITEDNIVWNQANQTVTLIKDGKFVQLKLGSSEMLVGGVTVAMDVAVSAKDNYTTLPAAWVAKAFGANATFDAATNTVTIK